MLDTALAKVQAQSGRRDWTLYGGDYANRRWSELAAIDRTTVRHLTRRFTIPTGAGKKGSLQTTPLVADGIMYLTSPVGHVVAWDLRRGRAAWRFRHTPTGELLCCGPVQPGRRPGPRPRLSRHARRQAHRARRGDRSTGLDRGCGLRRVGLQRDHGAAGGGQPGDRRHFRRRVRGARTRERVPRARRHPGLAPVHHPLAGRGRLVGTLVRHHLVGRAAPARPRPGACRLRALCRQLAPWRRLGVDRAGVRPTLGVALRPRSATLPRHSTRANVRATTCTPKACSPSAPRPAGSCGPTSSFPTIRGTWIRPVRRSWSPTRAAWPSRRPGRSATCSCWTPAAAAFSPVPRR